MPLARIQHVFYDIFISMGGMAQPTWIITNALMLGLLIFLVYRDNATSFVGISHEKLFQFLIVIFIFLGRSPSLIRNECGVDESEWIAGAITLMHDPRFWITVDGTTSGPLVIFPLCILSVFDHMGYAEIRLFGIFLWCLISVCLYRGLTYFLDPKNAKLAVLPMVACISQFDFYNFIGYNSEYIPLVLFSIVFVMLSKVVLRDIPPKFWDVFWIGLIAGLSPFAKLQALPFFALAGLYAWLVVVFQYKNVPLGLWMIVGAVIPSLFVFSYLTVFDCWDDFYIPYIESNLFYVSDAFGQVPFAAKLANFPRFLLFISETKLFFIVSSLVGLGSLFFIKKAWTQFLGNEKRFVLFLYAMYLIALYIIFQPGRQNIYFTHYLLFLVPSSALFYAAGLKILGFKSMYRVVPTLVIGLVFVYSNTLDKESFKQLKEPTAVTFYKSAVAQCINSNFPEAKSLTVWGYWNAFYVETQLRQGTREPHTYHQLRKGKLQKYYVERFLEDLKTHRPDVFIDNVGWNHSPYHADKSNDLAAFPSIAAYVQSQYTLFTTIDGNKVYVAKNKILK